MKSHQPFTPFVGASSNHIYYELLFKEAGGLGGGAAPPTCKPLEKSTLTVVEEGCLFDTIPCSCSEKARGGGGDSSPCVQANEIEGCDTC